MYRYLKVFITGELSAVRRETFGDLYVALKAIMQLELVVDFLQVPPVNQKGVVIKTSKGSIT